MRSIIRNATPSCALLTECPAIPYELSHLNALWDALGKTTVRDEEGEVVTDEPFLHFPTGTPLFHIWSWFESLHNEFVVAAKLYNTAPPDVSKDRKSK